MSSKMKGLLSSIIPLALMAEGLTDFNSNNLKPEDIDISPKDKPIPKGCKRYYYNKEGICSKSESEVFFDSLKPSNAYKKYQNWKQTK